MSGGEHETAAARTYGGWQAERVAFVFGLSGRRALLLAAAVLAVILPIATTDIGQGAVMWPLALILLVAAFVRVAGRTADEWVAAALSYQLGVLRRQHKFLSGPVRPRSDGPEMVLPGILAPVTILTVPSSGGRELAVACHRYDRTYTAVARVEFAGIGLVDSARRDQRVGGWGALIAGLCTESQPVVRVQALQRIVPESGAALRRWHTDHLAPDAPDAAGQITGTLLATASLATARRESYLAFTMSASRAHAAIKAAGGGESGAATVLLRHLRSLSAAIGGAELTIGEWLGPRDLAEVLRTAYDPAAQPHLDVRRAAARARSDCGLLPEGLAPGVAPALSGPAYAEARPGVYVHDGAASVTYWVHEWPRSQAYCTALAPLLGEGQRRSFSLVLEPLGPRIAERDVMRERTARHVAIRMRQRTGQLVPEHEQAAERKARAQDAERAAGHGLVRFTAYVTVTVTDPDMIEDACAALEADAAAARIEIRRAWFSQDIGFAATLPLGLGLPKRRW
jgi:hypothetical protein